MQTANPVFQNFLQARPTPQPKTQLLALAARSESDVSKALKENKKKLYNVQIPIASLMGLAVYGFIAKANPNQQTVQNFQRLLNAQQQVSQEILRLETNGLISEIKMPAMLKTALAQLKTTLYKGGSPYYTQKYIDDVRNAAAQWQNISILENQMEQYQGALKKVLRDRKGLQKLAAEPIITGKLHMSKHAAIDLASKSGEDFLQKLFEQGLSEANTAALQLAFKRLLTANQRMARLVSGVVTFVMVGFYTMLNKTQASKIYERGF